MTTTFSGSYTPAASSTTSSDSGTASTPAPTGPDAAGLNPAPASGVGNATAPTDVQTPGAVNQVTLDPKIASQVLRGGSQIGATPGKPAQKLDPKQYVQALADYLGVKAQKGKTLETQVVDALGQRYGVKIDYAKDESSGSLAAKILGALPRSLPGGQGSGGLGDSWQQRMAKGEGPPVKASAKQATELAKQAGIKNPRLRQQFIDYMEGKSPLAKAKQNVKATDTSATSEGNPANGQDQQSLLQMVGEIDSKLGINYSQQGQTGLSSDLETIGENLGVGGTSAPMPGVAGHQQTAGEAFVAFQKQAFDSKGTLTTNGKQWATDLENAGYLDKNANNSAPTSNQVLQAYSSALTDAVNNGKSLDDQLKAQEQTVQSGANNPTSEMQAFTQGIAQEFGVYLTPQQTTAIANEFGATATTAGDPSSVEDEIKDAVLQYYDPTNPNNPAGVANTMYVDMQQAAQQYGIPISNQALGNMVKSALQSATVESMYVAADSATSAATEQFQKQAEGLYPSLANQINAGMKVTDLVSPYFQVAEQYTGVPASTMQIDDPSGKWSSFLQGGQSTDGQPAMMTLDQWKKTLMQDPQYGFQNTTAGKNMASQFVSALLNEFGKVSTSSGSTGSGGFGSYQNSPGSTNSSGG